MCGFGTPGRITVHDALRETIAAIAAHAHYHVRTEAVGHLPLRPKESVGRRPDAALFDRGTGTWRLLDVMICNPLQAGQLPLASTSTGAAAAHPTAKKRHDYADAPANKPFVPLAVEVFGYLGADFHAFLADCALRATERSEVVPDLLLADPAFACPYSQCLQYFKEWVSCCLQRTQALSLLRRAEAAGMPSGPLPLPMEDPTLLPAEIDYTLASGPIPQD